MLRAFPLLLIVLLPLPAEAGLLISTENLVLAPNGHGTVKVTVSSDSGDSLSFFYDKFVLSGPGLEFATGQGEPEDAQLKSSDYVFPLDNSTSVINPPAGVIGTTTFYNDSYLGGDATIDYSGVVIPSNGALLVMLNIVATTAKPGDSFTISLDHDGSFFVDAQYNNIEFSSVGGEIRIENAISVPEPNSGLLTVFGSGLIGMLSFWSKQNRE